MRRLLSTRCRSLARSENAAVHDLVPCQDGRGRRAYIAVRALPNGNVWVEFPEHGPVYVRPLDVGRLRRALRSAVVPSEPAARTRQDHLAS